MKNNKEYIAPLIDIITPEPIYLETMSGGGDDNGHATTEAKVTHTFQFDDDIDELDDSSDSSEWCYVDYSNITFN